MSRAVDEVTRSGKGRHASTPVVAVCIASRGLVHSRLMEGVIRETRGVRAEWAFSHDEPIPEAQNIITRKALSFPKVTHLWYVEEDMLLPEGVLKQMLARSSADQPYIFVDYLNRADMPTAKRLADGTVEISGMGCLLVRRELVEQIGDPFFEKHRITASVNGKRVETGRIESYGGQDRTFCAKVRDLGVPLLDLPGEQCGHLFVREKGRPDSNDGWHDIRCYGGKGVALRPERTKIMPEQERVWIKSPTGTVIDQIKGSPEYRRFTQKEHWVEISEEEAQPYLEKLAERNDKIHERVNEDDSQF